LQEEQLLTEAYQRLARSDCSSAQLKAYLIRKGAASNAVETVIKVLKDQGYLNDARTAENITTELRHVKLWGVERVRQKLFDLAIDDAIITEQLQLSLADLSEKENLERAITKFSLQDLIASENQSEQAKAARKLSGLGYEEELITTLFS